jgi:L-iditol 2-dehydrogenase
VKEPKVKTALLTDLRKIEIRDLPDPKIEQPTDVLLRVDMVGVCGSDLHYYKEGRIGKMEVEFPWVLGHECVCTVVEAGPALADLKPGQRVAVDPLITCGRCDQCLAGRE